MTYFCFFLGWIQFVVVLFKVHSVYFCFSLSRSLVYYCSKTLVMGVSKDLSPPSISIRVALSPFPHQTHTTWSLKPSLLAAVLESWRMAYFTLDHYQQGISSLAWSSGLIWNGISKSLLLFLACMESGLTEIGALNNMVTLKYKILVIQQRAGGNTEKSLETSLNFHSRCTCVLERSPPCMIYLAFHRLWNNSILLMTLHLLKISKKQASKNYFLHLQRKK